MRSVFASLFAVAALAASAVAQTVVVLPTTGGANSNFIPFGLGTATQHQVFRADLFGATPVEITKIAFSPGITGTLNANVTIRLGYTSRTAGSAPPVGLDIPAGGPGAPNATGAMTTFYSNPAYSVVITATGHEAWSEMFFTGSFDYDPALGNLLVEIVSSTNAGSMDLHVSRANGSAESSRSYDSSTFGAAASTGTATRMQFTHQPAATSTVQVLPTTPHAASNFIPFSPGTAAVPTNNTTQHQVFRADLFGASPVEITELAFSPGTLGTYNGDVTIRLGYTSRTAGVGPPGGLDIPTPGGGGTPNATGAMTTFYSNPAHSQLITLSGSEAWTEFKFPGSFVYNPAQGNLLVEIVAIAIFGSTIDLSVSRSAGSAESSRAYHSIRFAPAPSPTTATRIQFTHQPATAGCYPDCNGDNQLNLADFGCFQTAFAGGNMYADCNGDQQLNLADFGCFQTEFAQGCP